jgi:hypothetical protein
MKIGWKTAEAKRVEKQKQKQKQKHNTDHHSNTYVPVLDHAHRHRLEGEKVLENLVLREIVRQVTDVGRERRLVRDRRLAAVWGGGE